MAVKQQVCGIACGIFKDEIKSLLDLGRLNIPFFFIDSMLHMHPDILETEMEKLIEDKLGKFKRIVIVFGDCHSKTVELTKNPRVTWVKAANCIEIMLGRDKFRELRKTKTFFLMPEWTERWEKIMHGELGLNTGNAKMIMQDLHASLTFLDTEIKPVPLDELQKVSAFT